MKRVVTGDGEEGSCGGGGAVSEKYLTYKGIISKLTTMFKETSAPYGTVQLVGLIFGRPELQLVQEQLMPNLSYWHHRSAKNIDFFCIGFTYSHRPAFEVSVFTETVSKFEFNTCWSYSGGTDLILLNVRYDQDLDLAVLDFTSAIAVTLEDAIADGAITNVQIFFEKIIRFAKKNEAKDPAWGFSDSLGVNIVGSSLKQLLLSLLPSEIKKGGKKAFHFIVKDIARSDLGNA